MIPATTGEAGLTAPQDSSNASLVALFTGPADDARTLVYDPVRRSVAEHSPGTHCGLLSRGRCAPGICGGCRARKVWTRRAV